VAALCVLLIAPPAHANPQERITAEPNRTVTRNYPTLIGTNPLPKAHNDDLNVPPDPDPPTCSSIPACDEIPLTIKRPSGFTVFDTFSVRIELRWQGGGDLDLYLWQEPPGLTPTRRAIGSSQPEVIVYPGGDSENYHLVVNNSGGLNQGYTLRVEATYLRGERPSQFDSPTTVPPLAVAPPLTTIPLAGTTDTTVGPATGARPPGAELIDPDLGNLSAAGPAPDIFGDASGDASRPPKPVAGSVVVIWGLVVPLVLASGVGALLYRRRPRALSYRR
jgi:hypothetical protein